MGHYSEEKGRIRLVVIGEGPIKPPRHPAFVYLGFVSERKKATLYRGALALCQPSLRESFSITIMEAWLAGRPVLVYEDCPVTKGHVQRSKGGLRFRTYEDFAGVLDWLQAHPELAARMGKNGRHYVLSNYTWDVILDRFEKILQDWKGT
jgi:glycosyltransferase involved in cell wall biosynthesis